MTSNRLGTPLSQPTDTPTASPISQPTGSDSVTRSDQASHGRTDGRTDEELGYLGSESSRNASPAGGLQEIHHPPSGTSEQTSPPVDANPPQGPVEGRSVAEIRADLAFVAEYGPSRTTREAEIRLVHDVEPLLSEVEAAHRFEQSAATDSARLAAVEALMEQARKVSPSGSMTVYVGDLEVALGRRPDSVRGIVGQNDVAAADAPQPEPATTDEPRIVSGCPDHSHHAFADAGLIGRIESRNEWEICIAGPSPAQPADPPTKETQR